MKFTSGQAASGMLLAVGEFALVFGVGTFIEALVLGTTADYFWSSPWLAVGPLLLECAAAGIFAAVAAGIGAIIATLVLGIGLTALASLILRRSTGERAHVVAFACIGAIVAFAVEALWFGTSDLSWSHAFGSWLVVLDFALVIAMAAARGCQIVCVRGWAPYGRKHSGGYRQAGA